MEEIKVGDVVVITNVGECYVDFDTFFNDLCMENQLSFHFLFSILPAVNDLYTVGAIGNHPDTEDQIALLYKGNDAILMGIAGIKVDANLPRSDRNRYNVHFALTSQIELSAEVIAKDEDSAHQLAYVLLTTKGFRQVAGQRGVVDLLESELVLEPFSYRVSVYLESATIDFVRERGGVDIEVHKVDKHISVVSGYAPNRLMDHLKEVYTVEF